MAATDPRYRTRVDGAPLAYVSEYLSFVGADAAGRVCFALDTNLGRDDDLPREHGLHGDVLQAEHAYAVLHDEHAGWVPLQGASRFPHPGPEVTDLPDSPWFTWIGSADTGWTLASQVDDLQLAVEPLVDRSVSEQDGTFFVMRSAAGRLTWRGRTLSGRVIHEGLASTRLNLLSRRSFSGLGGLEFLYLTAGDPSDATADVYLQKTIGEGSLAGTPPLTGFAAPATPTGPSGPTGPTGPTTVLDHLALDATRHRPGAGLFRWPTRWRGGWQDAGPAALARTAEVDLDTVSRRVVGRYGIAGFGMAVVSGTLRCGDGRVLPLYGFAELLAAGPLLHALARRPARRPT